MKRFEPHAFWAGIVLFCSGNLGKPLQALQGLLMVFELMVDGWELVMDSWG